VDKIAIDLGFRDIHWYGVFVALGFIIGLWTAGRRGRKQGLEVQAVFDLGFWLILGGILGARTMFVVNYWDTFFANASLWEIFAIHKGGLVFYGGLIGAVAVGFIWLRHQGLPQWKVADTMAPSIALGHAFGRLGCLMNGCCYGQACALPWAIHFPNDHETAGAGVHPTQLYESLANLGLYVALDCFYLRRRFDGQVFACYLMAYAILRSIVECFRGDYTSLPWNAPLTPGHWISIVVFLTGVGIYRHRSKPTEPGIDQGP